MICISRSHLLIILMILATGSIKSQSQYAAIQDSLWEIVSSEDDFAARIDTIIEYALFNDYAPFTKPFLDSAYQWSKDQQLIRKTSSVLINLGQYYNYASQFDSARIYLEEGLSDFGINDHLDLKCELLASLAATESRSGNIERAIVLFVRSLEILDQPSAQEQYNAYFGPREADKMRSIIHNNLGNLYIQVQDYGRAVEHYDAAIDLMKSLNAERYMSTVLMNKGIIYQETDRYEQALKIQEDAKALKQEHEATPRSIALSDLNIGICLRGLGRTEEALIHFNTALETFESLDNTKGITYALTERGSLYNSISSYEKALQDCTRSKLLLIQEGTIDYLENTYHCLYIAHRNLGNYREALTNHESYKNLQDSILNSSNIKRIGQLELEYEYEKDKALQALLAQQTERRNRWVNVSLIGLLMGLGIITTLIYRNLKSKSKSEKILADKNNQISQALKDKDLLLREIHHRVKNNLQFISSLLNLQSRHVEDDKAFRALKEGQNRVRSMAIIHQNLYQEENLTGVETKVYFEKLIQSLVDSYNVSDTEITVDMEIEPINLDVDTMIPIGLIANELISNAIKYAFPSRKDARIEVKLFEKDDQLHLQVSDNGIGLPPEWEHSMNQSFGYKLIRTIKGQLDADLKILNNDGLTVLMNIQNYRRA